MYCIQYDEICKKHNFELKHDALGERVTLEYPADSVPKDTIRLFQNHLPEGVSAMAEKYSSDRFAIFKYNAAAAAGNTIGLTETLEKNKKVSAALSDLADDLKQAELEAKTWVCTDPDTCQWRRQVGGTRYELYDIFEAPNGTYFVVHGEVDPTELDPDDYDQLLEAYSGLLDSANCESERWALIAEAQFETEELSMERERFSTFEGAERAIWKKVGADVSDENSATETRQLRDGEKLTEFFNRIDWKPLFEFVRRYFGIGVEQPPTTCLKPNGRIEVNWPENLRDKCGLFGHTYREVYLQTFSSCCFHDITYDKDIVDKYLARPDFYRLNISLENDCNGTSSDAYLQLTFSLKHIEFSGGYNFANLFSAEYRKDTGWFVVSGEGEVLMGAKK